MAGITHLEYFQKPFLSGIVDDTIANRQNTFVDTFLPNENVFSSTFTYDILDTNHQIAAVIAYGAEAPIADRDLVKRVSAEVVKLGIKAVVTEEELLALHNSRNDSEHTAAINHLTFKAQRLVKAILDRIYVQKAQALVNGELVYNANGVKFDVNFGLAAPKTPTKLWSDPTADVVGDLLNWVKEFEDNNNGASPSALVVSRNVMLNLMKNTDIIAQSGLVLTTTRVGEDVVNNIFGAYGLPPVTVVRHSTNTFKDIYTGNTITETIFDNDRVLLLGNDIGSYKLGPTVENNFQAGISLDAYDKQEPIESVFKAVAAGMPAIVRPKQIIRADVL